MNSSSSVSAASLIHDPAYPALKRQVIESTGLAYYLAKDNDLASRLGARLSDLELDNCGEYLRLLTGNESELHLLIAELTIGETYFFRHSEQFDALRETVIPDLIERNASTRRLRIWSAGCSTGPEPYSIAILLKQEFAHQLAGWDIQIIATDINQASLAQARLGRFTEWAMRATPESIRQRWFFHENKSWTLVPECRELVSFQYHNLVEHPFPSLLHNLVALDLILCRNVMIYFDWNVIQTVVDRFDDCLVDRGWLVVGYAEANTEIFRGHLTVNVPGATLYRKDSKGAGDAENIAWRMAPELAATWEPPDLPVVSLRPLQPIEIVASAPCEDLGEVRRLADGAKWAEAIDCCERLLLSDNLNPPIHFYRAQMLIQMGRNAESEQSLRRTIYLDRNFALAHYHLALLLQKNGDGPGAGQSLQNAERILSRMDEAFILAEADGMTVAELQELIAMQMEILSK